MNTETTPRPRHVMILGPHAWAKGKTEAEAMRGYKKHRYVRTEHEVLVLDVDPEATVDEMGYVERPRDAEPSRELKRVTVPRY